jgi:NAD(P)H-hydrate epimerase
MKPKAVTAHQMAEIDRRAQDEFGISQDSLMENAGRRVAEAVISDSPSIKNERIVIVCGKGNNGGDGFVVARLLRQEVPERLTVFAVGAESRKEGAALHNFELAREAGIKILPIYKILTPEAGLEDYTICIDALFGTGFKGELSEEYSRLGEALNSLACRRYAVDIPSGLDSTTGIAAKNCFKADKTITFGLPKKGFYLEDGPRVCGEIILKRIGFPETLLKEYI